MNISRVTKVVKGKRNLLSNAPRRRRKWICGCRKRKGNRIPDAIRKGTEDAKKNLIFIPMENTTIPHEIVGGYGAGKVLLKPGQEGTGDSAGGTTVRAVLELAGVRVYLHFKSLGSKTDRYGQSTMD